jgi:methionyl-tRNA formyltransferase
MKTVALVDGRLGMEVARYLAARDELSAVVLHPDGKRRHIRPGDVTSLGVPVSKWPEGYEILVSQAPECLLSVYFGFRVPRQWLEVPSWHAVNLHPGYLPDNRGRAATAWPLMDGSPAGATMHVMEEGFDTGAILAREHVPTYPEDTGDSLSQRVEAAALVLFHLRWPTITRLEPLAQEEERARYRSRADIDDVELDETAVDALNKLRAKTYAGGGITFRRDGRRYDVSVTIRPVAEGND